MVLQSDLEHSGDGEGLEHRSPTRRQQRSSRHHDGELVAHLGPELPGKHATDDHVPRTGGEIGEPPLEQMRLDLRHRRLGDGLDSVQHDRKQRSDATEHGLYVHERRGADDTGDRAGTQPTSGPIGLPAFARGHRGVRGERDEATAQLPFESVHDRDDRDERCDTQAYAEHRHPADEGDEKPAAAGPDVSQPEEDG